MALSVPLSRFTSQVGGGSAFFVSRNEGIYECMDDPARRRRSGSNRCDYPSLDSAADEVGHKAFLDCFFIDSIFGFAVLRVSHKRS